MDAALSIVSKNTAVVHMLSDVVGAFHQPFTTSQQPWNEEHDKEQLHLHPPSKASAASLLEKTKRRK